VDEEDLGDRDIQARVGGAVAGETISKLFLVVVAVMVVGRKLLAAGR